MKMKAFVYIIVLLTLVSMAFAQAEQCPDTSCHAGNADTECQCFGYAFGIAKDESTGSWSYNNGYDIDVTKNDDYDWTASPGVAGVLVKTGGGNNNFCVLSGGTSGSVSGELSVSHITFCGNDNGGGCTGCCPGDPYYPTCTPPVPEFSLITLGLAVLGAGLGLALLRKH